MKIALTLLAMTLLAGCTSYFQSTDWNVGPNEIVVGGSRMIPETYPGPGNTGRLQNLHDLVRLTISPDTSYGRLRKVFSELNEKNLESVVRLSNGKEVPLRIGCPESYFPYSSYIEYPGLRFAALGKSFVQVDEKPQQDEEDERRQVAYLKSIFSRPPTIDTIPYVDKDQWPWFLLYCADDMTYGDIEKYLIEVEAKGFYAIFLLGICK